MLKPLKVLTLLMVTVGVVGCVPASQPGGSSLALQSIEQVQESPLVAFFQKDLQALKIKVLRQEVYQYRGTANGAFQSWIVQVYRDNPGFCPIKNGFFSDPERNDKWFMTVLAKGLEVRVLIYDQSKQPYLDAVLLYGTTTDLLDISGSCF